MSTETIEPEVDESPSVLPMTPAESVEVGGDLEAACDEEHAVAAAENEGLLGVVQPVPAEATQAEPSPEADPAMKLALAHLYDVQDRLDDAISDHEAKADVTKTAKKRVESLHEDLSLAMKKLRNIKAASEPDPARFPLFDKAKAEINEQFARPEAIQPLPAETFEEALRRKQRDTMIESMGLKKGTLNALMKLELTTAGKIVARWNEGNIGKIPGMTEARQEEIAESLMAITDEALVEWNALHPDNPATSEDDDDSGDVEIDAMLDANAEEDAIVGIEEGGDDE